MAKKVKAEKEEKGKSSRREYDKFSSYTELLKVDLPKGERVTAYSYTNTIKYFHT